VTALERHQAGVCLQVFYISVCFDDAINRANADALGGIVMSLALNAGSLINDIGDAIAFANRFGRAIGYTRATRDAIFGNFHGHGRYSFNNLVLPYKINRCPM
jgi:hypothetical protein